MVYSYLLGNWVFVSSNVLLLFVALTGQWLYLRNKRRKPANSNLHPDRTAKA